MAPPPETRSSDRIGDLENRFQMQQTMLDSVHACMEQHANDIQDLKKSSSRLEDCLHDINTKLALLTSSPSSGKRPSSGNSGDGSNGGSLSQPFRIPTFGSFQEGPNSSSTYFIPTKQSRVEFPKFDGSDF